MNKKHLVVGLLMLATIALLTGCGGGETADAEAATEVPVVNQTADNKVVAEAVIEPDRWGELNFDAAGDVVEVLVEEGDTVSEGDVLAHLETTDLERAVIQAELDLSQAELRLSQAELRLEQLEEPADEADIRQAEHAVTQAAAALTAAQLDRTAVTNSTLLNESLEDAQELFDEMQHRYNVRVADYESGDQPDYWYVDQAKENLDDARLNLDRINQEGSSQSQAVRNAVSRALQSHQEAEDALARLLEEADELDVAAAQKDIEAAQLDVEAAELALEQAQSNLEDAILSAPFSGIVTTLNIDTGDAIGPGQTVVVLATLDQLLARTVDLTELDVARVAEGQSAIVTVDALPDQEFTGQVREISLQSEDYRGDVVYAVTVELTDVSDVPLRWGMTAMVEIETE
ncbi:MAG: HlyD family efflux transporter periplasmic adaptor subunit [Chloroflexi bacterium]|nr:HlyD family efflux transporter periplasmic adaptor subunit [Chloroflexota bacterium]